ncbi:MAG TPA: hypothetical protein V6D33_16060 [Cyanophyceae cyanobacterium]
MTYQKRLSPWLIIRLQPNLKHITVARCRRRCDAEGHVRVLKQMIPHAQFAIVFDCGDLHPTRTERLQPSQ